MRIRENILFYLSSFLMVVALIVMSQARMKAGEDPKSEEFYRYAGILAEVYEVINQRYVDPVKTDELFEASIQGMFRALDDHSQFMNADGYEYLNKETGGGFSGIGIHISSRNGVLTIISPIPGSPSARMGVKPWDRIVKIEGESTEGMTVDDAVHKLTGPKGTKVKITIYRPAERRTLDLEIARVHVKVDSIFSKMIEGDIGYTRISRFATDTHGDLKNTLLNFHKQGAKGIVLDLRYNTGGLLKEAISVSDLFLEKGMDIVSTRGRESEQNQVYKSDHEPVTRLPMVVLVNNGSASASEIVAAALSENKRAVLIGPKGQRTYGKWSVQTIEELTNSLDYDEDGNPRTCAVRLTTARYYSPNDNTYHEKGLAFDEEFEVDRENEVRLLTEGRLLGEVNMVEPEENQIDHFPTESEMNGATPMPRATPEPSPESSPTPAPTPAPADETIAEDETTSGVVHSINPNAPFVDSLLRDAVNFLRTQLMTELKVA